MHKSSPPFATGVGSALHGLLRQISACSCIDHLVSGLLLRTLRFICIEINYLYNKFKLAFATPTSKNLSLLEIKSNWPIMQKVHDEINRATLFILSLLNSIRFQVLFHSLWVLFHLSFTVLVPYRISN